MNLRVEGLTKVAALLPTALGGQGKQASTLIAGDMEIFLASDVIYSQRVAPLIQQTLASNGIHGLSTAPSRFLPNLGWLEPDDGLSAHLRQVGEPERAGRHGQSRQRAEGGERGHQHAGSRNPRSTTSAAEAARRSPCRSKTPANSPRRTSKADVTVTAGGKQFKASHAIEKTEPGKTVSVDIPVTGVPLGVASKIEVKVEGVPGENDLENNKSTYLAIFGQ